MSVVEEEVESSWTGDSSFAIVAEQECCLGCREGFEGDHAHLCCSHCLCGLLCLCILGCLCSHTDSGSGSGSDDSAGFAGSAALG